MNTETEKLTVMNATREQLLALPHRKWDDDTPTYDSVLVFSTGEKHDSGWDVMAIVGCRKQEPVEVCVACCDDIEWKIEREIESYGTAHQFTAGQYRMDCAPASGALHAWVRNGKWRVGYALSSTEIVLLANKANNPIPPK